MAMNMEVQRKNNLWMDTFRSWFQPAMKESNTYRFEKKFLIPLIELDAFRTQLAHFGCESIHQPRWIQNLYCDTANFQHFEENQEGLSNRRKLRFRWYGTDNHAIKVQAEWKIKHDDVNQKQSFDLGKFPLTTPINYQELFTKFKERMLETYPDTQLFLNLYEPSLHNRYYREYLLDAHKNIRVTIDTPIYYTNAQTGVQNCQENHAIIELKCSMQHPIILDLVPQQLSKSSKYVEGLLATNSLIE